MSSSLPNSEKFIKAALVAHAPLTALVGQRIYSPVPPEKPTAPETVIFPCVLFDLYNHSRSSASGRNETVLELPWYTVKAITKDSNRTTAYKIANAIQEALKNASGDVVFDGHTWTVQGVRIGDDFAYMERDAVHGPVNHVGARYRLFNCNER